MGEETIKVRLVRLISVRSMFIGQGGYKALLKIKKPVWDIGIRRLKTPVDDVVLQIRDQVQYETALVGSFGTKSGAESPRYWGVGSA